MISQREGNHLIRILFIPVVLLFSLNLNGLTEDEKNTIEVVKKNINSVVFIINVQQVRNYLYGSQTVAKGTGSGFI